MYECNVYICMCVLMYVCMYVPTYVNKGYTYLMQLECKYFQI